MSTYVVQELEDTENTARHEKMLLLIGKYSITVLAASDESDALAQRYVVEGALSPNSLMDANHIAIVSVNALDKIISLNFRHIVRSSTIKITGSLNILLGYNVVEINSPM